MTDLAPTDPIDGGAEDKGPPGPATTDLISREAAVALVIEACNECDSGCGSCFATADAIRSLPAVAPWAEEELISALTRTELNRYHAERIASLVLSRWLAVMTDIVDAAAPGRQP